MEVYIFMFLTLFVGLINADDSICMNKVLPSKNSIGGWRYHDVSSLSDEIKSMSFILAEQSLDEWYKKSHQKLIGLYRENGPELTSVYTQTVAGTNYCVTFEAKRYECDNDDDENDEESCAYELMQCEFKAFVPLPYLLEGAPLQDNINDVNCKKPKEEKDTDNKKHVL